MGDTGRRSACRSRIVELGANMKGMEEKDTDRLKAVLEEAARIKADREEERAAKLKQKTIQISFSEAELDRLRGKADASCLKLQDYIRKILSAYA